MALEVKVVDLVAMPALTVRAKVKAAEVAKFLGGSFGKCGRVMAKHGAKMAYPPFARYANPGDNVAEWDMEGGIGITMAVPGEGEVHATQLPGGPALVVDYYGPYEGIRAAYQAIEGFMKAKAMKARGNPWEAYVGDPGVEKDPQKVLTRVFWPIE